MWKAEARMSTLLKFRGRAGTIYDIRQNTLEEVNTPTGNFVGAYLAAVAGMYAIFEMLRHTVVMDTRTEFFAMQAKRFTGYMGGLEDQDTVNTFVKTHMRDWLDPTNSYGKPVNLYDIDPALQTDESKVTVTLHDPDDGTVEYVTMDTYIWGKIQGDLDRLEPMIQNLRDTIASFAMKLDDSGKGLEPREGLETILDAASKMITTRSLSLGFDEQSVLQAMDGMNLGSSASEIMKNMQGAANLVGNSRVIHEVDGNSAVGIDKEEFQTWCINKESADGDCKDMIDTIFDTNKYYKLSDLAVEIKKYNEENPDKSVPNIAPNAEDLARMDDDSWNNRFEHLIEIANKGGAAMFAPSGSEWAVLSGMQQQVRTGSNTGGHDGLAETETTTPSASTHADSTPHEPWWKGITPEDDGMAIGLLATAGVVGVGGLLGYHMSKKNDENKASAHTPI